MYVKTRLECGGEKKGGRERKKGERETESAWTTYGCRATVKAITTATATSYKLQLRASSFSARSTHSAFPAKLSVVPRRRAPPATSAVMLPQLA